MTWIKNPYGILVNLHRCSVSLVNKSIAFEVDKIIETYEDYKNAFDLYFLAQLKPQLSLEVKFLTLAQGLEVYHRRLSSDDAPEMDAVTLKYKELVQGLIEQYPNGKEKK